MFTISSCRNYNRAADPPCLTFADGASVTHAYAHVPNMPSHLPLYIRRHADNPQQVCTNVCPATCWACYAHDIAGFSYLAPCPLLLDQAATNTCKHRCSPISGHPPPLESGHVMPSNMPCSWVLFICSSKPVIQQYACTVIEQRREPPSMPSIALQQSSWPYPPGLERVQTPLLAALHRKGPASSSRSLCHLAVSSDPHPRSKAPCLDGQSLPELVRRPANRVLSLLRCTGILAGNMHDCVASP